MLHRNDLGTWETVISDTLHPLLSCLQYRGFSWTKLFFSSPCSWLLCLNEPICWRTPPGRTWSLTRTDAGLQHVVSGKNQFLHERTEICSCISVLAISSGLLWYLSQPWPGGKSQGLFPFNLFPESVWNWGLMAQGRESKGRGANVFVTAAVNGFVDMLFILGLMWFLGLELLFDIQGIISCQRPGWLRGRAGQTKFDASSETQEMDPQGQNLSLIKDALLFPSFISVWCSGMCSPVTRLHSSGAHPELQMSNNRKNPTLWRLFQPPGFPICPVSHQEVSAFSFPTSENNFSLFLQRLSSFSSLNFCCTVI